MLICVFSSLIVFVKSPDSPSWHGYVLAVIILILSQIQNITYEQYYNTSTVCGLKIRTTMMGMVYRKVPSVGDCFDITRQTRYVHPMLIQCWASVADGGPILNQHWVNVLCSRGKFYFSIDMRLPYRSMYLHVNVIKCQLFFSMWIWWTTF